MFEQFARRYDGWVVEILWCREGDGVTILPSCEGHATVFVRRARYIEACKAAALLNSYLQGFGDVTVLEYSR